MVNSGLGIYLTDFLESRFSREFAKIRGFCGGEKFQTARIHHFRINHARHRLAMTPGLEPLAPRSIAQGRPPIHPSYRGGIRAGEPFASFGLAAGETPWQAIWLKARHRPPAGPHKKETPCC